MYKTQDDLEKTHADIENVKKQLENTRKKLNEEREEFDHENEEQRDSILKMKDQNHLFQEDIKRLSVIETKLLKDNDSLVKQVENLNELHNKSTNMIRQLAMYGDDCKTFGKDLKETADNLKDTDDSLGLTSEELSRKIKALDNVVNTLTKHVTENI